MMEMFRYLTGTLEREEQKTWKILAIADFISPVADLESMTSHEDADLYYQYCIRGTAGVKGDGNVCSSYGRHLLFKRTL